MPMARSWANRSIIEARLAMPDRFYIRGVRPSSLKERTHIFASNGPDVSTNRLPQADKKTSSTLLKSSVRGTACSVDRVVKKILKIDHFLTLMVLLFWCGEKPEACGEEEWLSSLKKRIKIKVSFSGE